MEILGEIREGTYKVDPNRRPMTIDLIAEGKTIEGIFRFQGDNLILCSAEPGTKRPRVFAAPDGVEYILWVWRRANP
jgi:uncharacterized protein (TIGR03067 family)